MPYRFLHFLLIATLFLSGLSMSSQSAARDFTKLSSPEKWWVICHPFKAKRALEISQEALRVTDSLEMDGSLGADRNGGDLDAFKHGYWMARLSAELGSRAALKLGRAHEKGNYRDFKKGRKEDGALPDGPSSEMDLFNNARGAELVNNWPGASKRDLTKLVCTEVSEGKMRVLHKKGKTFLDCQGRPLEDIEIRGLWDNDKCLVPSGR